MSELKIERVFPAPQDRVFAFISQTENLLKWWGPEGMHTPEHALSFEKTGPWFSVMVNGEGGRFKVSGQVTHVDAPNSVGFTWGWHDDEDRRGEESHVTISLTKDEGGGTRLVLAHRDLGDDEMSARHEEGWTSSLRKLEQLLNA